jgi:hypothetical protein
MHKARAFFFVCAGIFLLALWVPIALAGGVNINWGSGCWSDGTPVDDLAFTCNTNTGSATMTCSFAVSQNQPEFVSIALYLDGVTERAIVPAWWQMGDGDCRGTAISVSENFLAAPQIGCVDMWADQAAGGLAVYGWGPVWGGNNRTHIAVAYAVPPDMPIPLSAGVEYYAARVVISYVKTVGSGSCAGCLYPMIWNLTEIDIYQLTEYETLLEPLPRGNQCLQWQHSTLGCPHPVPARNTTWGQVKSLYR